MTTKPKLSTLAAFTAFAPKRLAELLAEAAQVAELDSDWHPLLQDAIDTGAYIELRMAFSAAGEISSFIQVVGRDGRTDRLPVGDFYA